MRRRLAALLFCLSTAIVASGCGFNPFFFLPAFHEGPERVVPTKPEWIVRGKDVQACLTRWARSYFRDSTITYADSLELVVMKVGGDGVIGTASDGSTFQVAGAERGDTILVNEGLSESSGEFVAIMRHEFVHVVQSKHREVIGADGNVHWPAPFTYCQVPLAIFR